MCQEAEGHILLKREVGDGAAILKNDLTSFHNAY